ncbi:putative pentafunctional AROM polypeptide [Aspergillus thermomutatus]|uniref:Uncharacterized protein n=1 Tax=Aspergillus thermomutatus TaxID=41047 RepID=A0A397HJZ1_ASPTH|nr:uncharacterized protein CDV56_109242 [Aspergillus thermomutatus]RHZ63471.1 hypothetical protein CDV56_109242 [Aspergillus thermomutatus]
MHTRASTRTPESSTIYSRKYLPDATLLLIGFFGAGKKTLGIIASVALHRRFIDFDAFFREQVNSSPQAYIAAHGLAQYRSVEGDLTRELLTKCSKGCVIVGLGAVASNQQQVLLKDFAREHPMVYVRRAESELRQFVGTSQDKFERFWRVGNTFFETCSNFEFYNQTHTDSQEFGRQLPSSLKLKETERLFVGFVQRIYGPSPRSPFSSELFPEVHTFALQVPLAWLDSCGNFEILDAGADAITLLIDVDGKDQDRLQSHLARHMATLRLHSRVPVVADVRLSTTKLDTYRLVLEMLLRLVPDAVTCSLSCPNEIIQRLNATKGSIKTIATCHQSTPLGRDASQNAHSPVEKANQLGFDCIRITGESCSIEDNLACVAFRQRLIQGSTIPVIAYNTGISGRASICLNPTLSPVVPTSMDATGITILDAQKALTSCFLATKKRFTLVGQALEHTLSPAMHNAAYTACGLPHSYEAVQAATLSEIRTLLDDESHGGVAISIPYKTAILPMLDEISSDARDINAVNTVVIERHRQDGQMVTTRKGYNTDYIGVRNCIHKHLSPANAIRDGTTVLIIGAGGMAHAAIYACHKLGARQFCIYNRTLENARKLAEYFHRWTQQSGTNLELEVIHSVEEQWPTRLRQPTIVISCLPGQQVGSEEMVDVRISEQWLQSTTGGVFLEVAYGPSKTPLMEQMLPFATKGWVVVDGLSLLVEQGIAQYEIFTKRPAPVHVMRKMIYELSKEYGYLHR